jgi:hypothetical protein
MRPRSGSAAGRSASADRPWCRGATTPTSTRMPAVPWPDPLRPRGHARPFVRIAPPSPRATAGRYVGSTTPGVDGDFNNFSDVLSNGGDRVQYRVAASPRSSADHVLTSATRRRTSTLATLIAHSRLGQTVAEPIHNTRSFILRSYGWISLPLQRQPLHSRYWHSAAGARGSAATEASGSCNAELGSAIRSSSTVVLRVVGQELHNRF